MTPNADLVALVEKALEDDGWLGTTVKLERWHLHTIAKRVVEALPRNDRSGTA